ncbi:maltose/maltodextrin transport ATP-binding protein malK [Vibrio sp. JCM 19236]|nr:maltose/maltodextrin transport ATP-binding protein malK [Vibrio sp. JCM 19236]
MHGIDLDIREGEFMVFVGPSGCAKSTTLRMIAGLESITGGDLRIGGERMNDVPSKDRGIAMVFQDYALYPHMTVFDNMSFGLKVAKLPKDEIEARVREAAEKLQITDLLERKPAEMSGGQRQRVAVGRAIVRKPDVFLFDEPLSNLDAKLRVSMRLRITNLHKELKQSGQPATMIYVTHDQVESMTMGDRICVLNQGRIMQVDTPMNLYNFPANKFVAGFIGSPAMNLLKATLVETEQGLYVEVGEEQFALPKEKAEKLSSHAGKAVWFGIRPEYVGNAETHPECTQNSFTSEIQSLERMGFEENLYFELGGQECSARVPHEKAGNSDVGEQYQFCIDMNKCHIFDMDSELNLSL